MKMKHLFECCLGILLLPLWLRWRAHERAVLCDWGEGQTPAVTVETEER